MSRLLRKTIILAKTHATYTTDPVPTGAANAMLVSNCSIDTLNADSKDRDVIRAYLGASEQLLGSRYKSVSFDIELVGGLIGVAPNWGPLIRACGFAETITAVTRVDYTPVSNAFDAVAIYYFDDGLLHKLLGARGTCSIKATVGEIPKMSFKFVGLDGGDSAVANPTADTSLFQVPQVVIDANTDDLTWGGTHAAVVAPAITAGTTYPSQGLELDFGVSAPFTPLLGGESVPITQRSITGFCAMDLTAAQAVTFQDKVRNGTLESLGLKHGTGVGKQSLFFMPNVQCVKPEKREINGIRLEGYSLRMVPTSAGNDEFRLVTSF
jgi:hypothetical protein